jgi:hypothetical protein
MLVVSKAQIDSIRNKEITELISSNDLDPNASSIERLIQLFKRDSKVSFLYVMHKPGTGFVTQYKEKGSVTTSDTAISNDSGSTIAHINPVAENEMSMWRKANDLGEEHKVVVSFAWAHNEEARLFSMFPEFSCVDLTFGTNRERRPLLIFMRMGPVLKGNRDYLQKLNACDTNGEDDEVVDNFDPTVDCGKTDNVEFIASPSRMIRNLPPPAVVGFPSEDIEDTRLYHAFYAAQNAAESDGDKEYLLQFLIKAETEFTAKSRKKQITSEETVIFNAYEGNKVLSAKRHKQMHERFTKK